MRFLLLVLSLFNFISTTHAQEGFGLGFEVGVAQMRNDSLKVQGSSWMFHADFELDPLFSFFGVAGQEFGRDGDDKIAHNLFGGGVSLALLPMLDLRAGLALNTWQANEDGSKDEEEGLGPLVGVTAHQTTGALKWGASANATRTGDYQSLALRVFLIVLMI
jgi:hypothetical protein